MELGGTVPPVVITRAESLLEPGSATAHEGRSFQKSRVSKTQEEPLRGPINLEFRFPPTLHSETHTTVLL